MDARDRALRRGGVVALAAGAVLGLLGVVLAVLPGPAAPLLVLAVAALVTGGALVLAASTGGRSHRD